MQIKPLPISGKPKEFDGAVGEFKLEASVNKTRLKVGEALNLKVTVSGKGNEKSIKNIVIGKKERFEVFDPEITSSADVRGGNVTASKTFRYVMIPQTDGEQELGPVTIYFFNPSKGTYDSSSTLINISVEKGKGTEGSRASTYTSKSEIKVFANDIRYIKTEDRHLSDKTDRFDTRPLYFILIAFPFLYTAAFLIYRRHSIRIRTDAEYARNRKARKQAEKWLLDAKKLVSAGKGFDDAVHKSISGFVADKLNLPSGSLTTTDIKAALEKKNISDQQLLTSIFSLLERCDFGRFASITDSEEERQNRFNAAAEIISRLAREL